MARIFFLEKLALCPARDARLMLEGLNDVIPFVGHPSCGQQLTGSTGASARKLRVFMSVRWKLEHGRAESCI
jgi:hypothetical protein